MEDKINLFKSITQEMCDTYIKKNHDYGDSFNISLNKYGLIAGVVRMEDKINRISSLSKKDSLIKEETIADTLSDLANYAIMTLMWLKKERDTDSNN